jgi:hexokinase
LIASAYNDPDTIVGAIFGTGCNAAYMETVANISKLKALLKNSEHAADMPGDTPMAINCEYGAFDNAHKVLPRTKYDEQIDNESPRPGQQAFEKMSAGLYLGEIFRLVVKEMKDNKVILKSASHRKTKIDDPYTFDTGLLSKVENDESSDFSDTKTLIDEVTGSCPTSEEAVLLQKLANLIALRGARLCACGVSAICLRKGVKEGHVAADGSVANKHPHFKRRWETAVAEILDLEEPYNEDKSRKEGGVRLTSAEDGSGMGAAVIVALTMQRAKEGRNWGIRNVKALAQQ